MMMLLYFPGAVAFASIPSEQQDLGTCFQSCTVFLRTVVAGCTKLDEVSRRAYVLKVAPTLSSNVRGGFIAVSSYAMPAGANPGGLLIPASPKTAWGWYSWSHLYSLVSGATSQVVLQNDVRLRPELLLDGEIGKHFSINMCEILPFNLIF